MGDGPRQRWTIGGGAIQIDFGLCLDVSSDAAIAGASGIAYGCHCGPNQAWSME